MGRIDFEKDLERGDDCKSVDDEKRGEFLESQQSSPTLTQGTFETERNAKESSSTPSSPSWTTTVGKAFSWPWSSKSEIREDELKVRKFSQQKEGYPHLAAFLDSDENFMLYRRFGFLQARLLLNKQDQLRALEEQLDEIDSEDDEEHLKSRDMDDADETRRTKLLKKIEVKFKEYAELLTIARDLTSLSKPAARDYRSVRNYFEDKGPVVEDEKYINHKEDIITLKPGRENAWLDAMVERGLRKFASPTICYLFCSPETRAKADQHTILYSKSRIDALVTTIITLMILFLLIIPIYVLWHLASQLESGKASASAVTIGVLLVFTLIFSAVLSLFTRARRHEILGAAAAYCAVLVVFISNVGQNGPS